ncbi:HAD-IIIA family hydrolase [Kitasatospora sp. NPDC127111]|uniref:HAD-IIIA family hydrolase n=1 Tax=Kitasatospora sp. NPDC127111 TaxID=3345363 RepID=UPI0036282194
MAYLAAPPQPTVPQPRPSDGLRDRPEPWLFVRPGVDNPTGAVLFERDGTLIQDVACNGDPAMVHPVAGIRAALAALRGARLALGVISNQSGVARGVIGRAQVEAVQARAEALLGPVDVWAVCPHGPHDGCGCHMPDAGLVSAACRALGLPPGRVTVVAGSDTVIEAALTAGAHAIRVPTTRPTATAAGPCPPCTLTICRTAECPEEAADLLLTP